MMKRRRRRMISQLKRIRWKNRRRSENTLYQHYFHASTARWRGPVVNWRTKNLCFFAHVEVKRSVYFDIVWEGLWTLKYPDSSRAKSSEGSRINNSNVRYNLEGMIYGKSGCWLCKGEVREVLVSHQRRPSYRRGRTHYLSKSLSLS